MNSPPPSPNERLEYSLDDQRPVVHRLSRQPLWLLLGGVSLILIVFMTTFGGETEEREPRDFRSLDGRTEPWWEGEPDGVVVAPAPAKPAMRRTGPVRSASLQAAMDAPLQMSWGESSEEARGAPRRTSNSMPVAIPPGDVPVAPQLYVRAGSVIPAVLITAIHSDLPGPLVAQVSEDVRDTTSSNFVLIPKGTRVLCAYESAQQRGQSRLVVGCSRLVFPDGRSKDLPFEPGAGLAGTVGVPGDVNRHLLSTFGTTALLAIVSGGVQVSQGTFDRNRTDAREVMAGALGQELGRTSTEILRRELNRPPTIEVEAGSRLQILVTQDLGFERPYGS